ncbi:MAG: DHH family phosphoesterase [Candidatus Pacearchaeota archaeon]
MKNEIKNIANIFLEKIKNSRAYIITHFDTDGITSAAIFSLFLKKIDVPFKIKIVPYLEKEFIKNLNKETKEKDIIIFLDLGSSYIEELENLNKDVFILDHHETEKRKKYERVFFINPHLFGQEQISAAGLCYFFSKALNKEDKEMANLAVIGMVGDVLEREISKMNNEILNDAEVVIKKGLMLYPSTRPINKTLEYSNIFIPGVTGDSLGVIRLLNECGIKKENGSYKTLLELNKEEVSKLITSILLRTNIEEKELIGNIYLIKFFNKLSDARDISSMINACSRLGYSETALLLCLQKEKAIKKAEEIYAKYKQEIINGLQFIQENKIEGKNYIIINAKSRIRSSLIGTITSILIHSISKEKDLIIVGMAYDSKNIKVSVRVSNGLKEINAKEILEKIVKVVGGEYGGHKKAAGCIINKNDEDKFLEILKKNLEIEVIKI